MPSLPARLRLFVSLALLALAGAARADNLVSLVRSPLPAIDGATVVTRFVALDGRLLAFTDTGVRQLDEPAGRWAPVTWAPDGTVVAATGNGRQAFVLVAGADGLAGRAQRLTMVNGAVQAQALPPLPRALREAGLAQWRDTLHAAGRADDGTPAVFTLATGAAAPAWSAVTPWPADGAVEAVVAQDAALFIGLASPGEARTRLWRWTPAEGWKERAAAPDTVVPGSARPVGQAHILFLGGQAGPDGRAHRLHSYHTITDTWTTVGTVEAGTVTAGGGWRNGVVHAGVADAGGIAVGAAQIEMRKRLLKVLDWVVIVGYLAGMAGVGFYCYLREKRHTTADFFVGGRSIPFWAAGLSLYATGTSAISYIAIPAKSFATNWFYLAQNVVGLVATIFVALWIVPLIRRLDVMSVYHYLELRFHPVIRMFASAICIVLQLGGRMSVVLFLPSLAISAVTGVDVVWSILIMGLITIVYTVLGGMKAVIWTDVIQVFVMLGGAFFAIGYVVFKIDGGFGGFVATAAADDKFALFDWSWDLTKATVWGFIFLAVLDVITYPKDQVMMQRVLSTRSAKEAGWSVWTLAAVVVPGSLTFYAIGTALYAYYRHHPEKMNPLLTIDATFPHFIAAELPVGITGLIIAGIFAASMSTLSSCINSVATLVSVDFYEKLAKKPDPKVSVRIAEALTIVAGLIGVGTALLLSRFDIRSFFDLSLELAGLLGGGFAGTYALGMFTRRANWQGAAIGISVSIVVTMIAWSMRLVHSFFYTAIAILTCIVVGYVASLFFPPPSQDLSGLNVFGRHAGPRKTPS